MLSNFTLLACSFKLYNRCNPREFSRGKSTALKLCAELFAIARVHAHNTQGKRERRRRKFRGGFRGQESRVSGCEKCPAKGEEEEEEEEEEKEEGGDEEEEGSTEKKEGRDRGGNVGWKGIVELGMGRAMPRDILYSVSCRNAPY